MEAFSGENEPQAAWQKAMYPSGALQRFVNFGRIDRTILLRMRRQSSVTIVETVSEMSDKIIPDVCDVFFTSF